MVQEMGRWGGHCVKTRTEKLGWGAEGAEREEPVHLASAGSPRLELVSPKVTSSEGSFLKTRNHGHTEGAPQHPMTGYRRAGALTSLSP